MLRTHWKTIVGILVLLGLGTLFLYQGLSKVWDEFRLTQGGEITSGFIVDTWEDYDPGERGAGRWYHGGTYTYQIPDGRVFEGKINNDGRLKSKFRSLEDPYPVNIVYLVDEPTISSIEDDLPDSIFGALRKQIFLGWVASFFFFMGFFSLMILIKERRKEKNLPPKTIPFE